MTNQDKMDDAGMDTLVLYEEMNELDAHTNGNIERNELY